MGDVGGDLHYLAGLDDVLFAFGVELEAAFDDHGHLLVFVMVERDHAAFLQAEVGDGHAASVQGLAGEGRVQLLKGDLFPAVQLHTRGECIMGCRTHMAIKGVVLAGGTGSRLFPLTKITNKHLLPVYDKPMIYYPIQTLVDAGIEDILIVTGGRNAGDFLRLLANGKEFGLSHLDYTYQEGEGGIAEALGLAHHFGAGHRLCVILGDNIIQGSIREAVDEFRKQPSGAKILLKQVEDAERFGVAEIEDGKILGIEEKPKKPKSDLAVTGIYMYDETVFDKVQKLKRSDRGELEITDVNNAYIAEGSMTFAHLDGWWTDAGTFESLLRANNLVAETREPSGE